MAKTIIRSSHATFGFHDVLALKDISLEVSEGEFVGVIGPNGSGKTTLCRAVLGLLRPLEGSLQIFDCACEQLRCHHRARIGYLPQKGALDRNFPITVLETVMMGRYGVLGLFHRPRKRDREIALEALVNVGMQQPQVLLLDEPTTGIDITTQHSVLELIRRLHQELGLTVLLITHDINMIRPLVDRLVLLKTRLFAAGPPDEVLKPDLLSQVYGKELVITEKDLVIVEDYHHHR